MSHSVFGHVRPPSTLSDEEEEEERKRFEEMTLFLHKGNSRDLNMKRAKLLGFTEENVKIAPGANVRLGARGSLGKNVFVGLFSYVNGDVAIEDEVLIGPHCVLTSNTHMFNPENQTFRGRNSNKPILVQRGSWIAAGCTITAGVVVGKCCLITANTVVTKDVPSYSIVAGTPGRVVGTVNHQTGDLIWHETNAEPPQTQTQTQSQPQSRGNTKSPTSIELQTPAEPLSTQD
eukprot:TRINITY_DN2507_c0_g1_i1.p2 TRINITY_DN2507_c0_g1~~TRINITY_DN2507_c0_g1_i1.p2  ORF type:complete len:232 (-),score=36.04 TRINITY_DN2507_c0_g1_i1:99-794(-)